ncbi:hypothetical protein OIV83_000532 [Microbotryomycetes sp. JL201]|nr:hypothetical protein OIV83_000532 [Microbotryomycetes sp. JL201]
MNYLRAVYNSFMPRATSPEDVAKARELVENMILSSRVAVFSKSYCPYCTEAKRILQAETGGEGVTVLELDQRADGSVIQQYLAERAQQTKVTVPQIYIRQQLRGGCSELKAIQSQGKLAGMLA